MIFIDFPDIFAYFYCFSSTGHPHLTHEHVGCVGRPHCVQTSFMDRFRGLTEHNCLKTRLLGSPLRRQDAKSDGKWVLNQNINILEQNQ